MIPLIQLASQVLVLLVIARALLSWFPAANPSLAPVRLLYQTTDPLLRPIQRVLPTLGGIDFSPFVAILIVQLAARLLVGMLGVR